jgi:hypothetical protein
MKDNATVNTTAQGVRLAEVLASPAGIRAGTVFLDGAPPSTGRVGCDVVTARRCGPGCLSASAPSRASSLRSSPSATLDCACAPRRLAVMAGKGPSRPSWTAGRGVNVPEPRAVRLQSATANDESSSVRLAGTPVVGLGLPRGTVLLDGVPPATGAAGYDVGGEQRKRSGPRGINLRLKSLSRGGWR